ncbi:MAG: hypothetical protein IKN27_08160 [Selenomonadaceae bacterium]|nr:hypothetical protein [Selenomonadaceae bacterium]
MKKFFAALSLFALMNFGTCAAEMIHVTGHGNTERMAIHNALRLAVEQKFGAVVNSKTFVKDKMLASDENSVDSNGFVTRYEIVSSRVVNGIYIVELNAELNDKISSRLTELEKKSLVDVNTDNPRIAVAAFDSNGRRCTAVENEIVSALKRQGFTRTVDLEQVNRAVRQRINSASNDKELCKTLANDFHADCLVVADVKISGNTVDISSRMIELNTGEIIFAGTTSGDGEFLSSSDALKLASRRAAGELSSAAFKDAAKIERHVTLLVTKNTFEQLGGTLTAVRERIKNISGVNDAFARKLNSSLELDIDFDGTAADFAQLLEIFGLKILELGASFVKI